MEKANKRLSRQDWIAQAMLILKEEGINGLRVERLASHIGVTKGSFYWHFKDLEDLLREVLDYWASELTTEVRDKVKNLRVDAKDRLLELMKTISHEEAAEFDLAVRSWAAYDEMAANVVRKVDKERLTYIRSLFSEMGFREQELEVRTWIFVCYFSLENGLFVRLSRKERLELVEAQHAFFTRQ